ncbi:MAG: aminotransferase class V-fold PLP-dependent enzyme, partial [Bacteroidia bacterium]
MYDLNHIRSQFPILKRQINGRPLVYFDNGATTQKPQQVIDAIVNYYSRQNANIHRGVHTLSREATILFEDARKTVAGFVNAAEDELIFTAGTTDSINTVAGGLPFKKGAEIIVSEMEHHSNILPWQLLCERNEGKLKVIPVNHDGSLQLEKLNGLITGKTALIALTQVSNTLGVINPVKDIIKIAHQKNCLVLIDGAQSVPHQSVDVQDL